MKRTANRGITQFTLALADVAGCVCFAKITISKKSEGQDDVENAMRKLRSPIKIEPFTSHLYTATIK